MKRMRKDNHPVLHQVPNAFKRQPSGSPTIHSAPSAHAGLLPLGNTGRTSSPSRRRAPRFVNVPTT